MEEHKSNDICEGCGTCCTCELLDITDLTSLKLRQFRKTRAVGGVNFKGRDILIMPQPCKHYSEESGCAIYEDRPIVCRQFPQKEQKLWEPVCELYRKLYKGE